METEDKLELEAAARFMHTAVTHISEASDRQRETLLKVLLERPPNNAAINLANHVWAGLTEKEFMLVCKELQKNCDKDFWEFATRWRTK